MSPFARHSQAPTHEVDINPDAHSIAEAEHATKLQAALVPSPVEIESPRVGVDLNGDAVIRARLENFLDIDLIAGPAQAVAGPSCGPRIVTNGLATARSRRSVCSLRSILNCPFCDEIELAQDLVRIVERPVEEDIGLDALEDAKAPVEPCVEAIDLGMLLADLLDAEAPGVTGGL
jgi:hypothetical protein